MGMKDMEFSCEIISGEEKKQDLEWVHRVGGL